MPARLRLKIISARNLPIMDRSSDSSDAFVEVKLGENCDDKTQVCKRSLDPVWNARFMFELEEDELQEEPLQIRVLDHDTYTSHDAIGKVYIDLKPLLNKDGPQSINGWFPIYDTMHGIRGEIQIQAKIELFNDLNEYRKSSSGIQFFSSSKIPEGYQLQNICGFVEELVINDDPEYQWIDKIRAPRTSNEARQKLFSQLSGEVQRRIGLKALDMQANCVLGYLQYFDLEGEHGIVVRGIGSACFILKQTQSLNANLTNSTHQTSTSVTPQTSNNSSGISPPVATLLQNDTQNAAFRLKRPSPCKLQQRVHSDPNLSCSPNGLTNLLHIPTTAPLTNLNQPFDFHHRQQQQQLKFQNILDKMEYPFLTIQQYPSGFIKSLCGVVCARSVKLHSTSLNDTDLRDKWWSELRNEIKSQMKSLNCHLVLGYTELKSICEDVFVLSAMGTAALIDEKYYLNNLEFALNDNVTYLSCSICHLVQNQTNNDDESDAVNGQTHMCGQCGQFQVPEVLFTTIQPVSELQINGQGALVKALVSRPIKKSSNEQTAKIISDCLPFIEYELHRQLLNKLKLKGMNSLFNLKMQISIGENVVIGKAEGTAAYLNALPQSRIPKLLLDECISKLDKSRLSEIQELKRLISVQDSQNSTQESGTQQEEFIKIDLDDDYDKENIHLLLDSSLTKNKGMYACNTEFMPGITRLKSNVQMFTRVHRCEKSLAEMHTKELNDAIDQVIASLNYKFRFLSSFCLTNLSFDITLYDDDHAMIICTGCCFKISLQRNDGSLFQMDDHVESDVVSGLPANHIETTTLSYVPNYRIESYLGHINLFLIRESTCVKEIGGLNGFMHTFISEVLCLTRAHVLSLGGNAFVSFKITECFLLDNPHKNQGQCLINVAGDAVKIVK